MVDVVHGVCVGSWEKFKNNVAPHLDGAPVVAVDNQSSIAPAYNAILDAAAGLEPKILVLQHDDLEVVDPDARSKFLDACEDETVGLVGVAGGVGLHGLGWWGFDPIGHQLTDSGLIDFGTRCGDVDLVEGSVMVLPYRTIERVQFDERFVGFHGYDDVGMIVRSIGLRVVVVNVDTHHHTVLGFKSNESARAWADADRLYREKWRF